MKSSYERDGTLHLRDVRDGTRETGRCIYTLFVILLPSMPRQPRLDAPGVLHHVMVRGIERRVIFRDDVDRADFVDRLAALVSATGLTVYAWALLPNHAHCLVRTGTRPLPRVMRSLLTGYAGAFNRRHKRTGHLFQNRYKSIVVEEEPYLLELVRYLHLNPLRARTVPHPPCPRPLSLDGSQRPAGHRPSPLAIHGIHPRAIRAFPSARPHGLPGVCRGRHFAGAAPRVAGGRSRPQSGRVGRRHPPPPRPGRVCRGRAHPGELCVCRSPPTRRVTVSRWARGGTVDGADRPPGVHPPRD